MVKMLKHTGREIGTNSKNGDADKCAKMVKLVNGKTGRGESKW